MSRQLAYRRTCQGKVDRGFKHLQSLISCRSSRKSTSSYSLQTKTNARFKVTKHLLLTALWLLSAANVLEEYTKVICSNQSSHTLISNKSHHLKKYIVPMISYAANSLAEISKSLALHPFPQWIMYSAEWKSKGRVTFLIRVATAIWVLTCNAYAITLPAKKGYPQLRRAPWELPVRSR